MFPRPGVVTRPQAGFLQTPCTLLSTTKDKDMITNKIIKELIAYFEAIEDRNGQEDNLLGELEASKGDFPAVVLRRTDLIGMGVDIDRITDSQMESLACQVEERLSKRYNWHEVEDVVRNFEGLPQFNEH